MLNLRDMHAWTDGFQTDDPTGDGSTNYAKYAILRNCNTIWNITKVGGRLRLIS